MIDLDPLAHPEYQAPDGEVWRVELGVELCSKFELDADSLPRWHAVLFTQGIAWTVLRRLYAIAPLYGVEDASDLTPCAKDELALKLQIKPEEVERLLNEAVALWRRSRPGTARKADEARPAKMTAEVATALLLENGFVGIDDEEERLFVADRIKAMQPFLDSDSMRSMARSVIQQELTLFFVHDVAIAAIRARIREQSKREPKPALKEETETLTRLSRERKSAQEGLEASLKILGLTEMQSGDLRKKTSFTDCLSAIVEAVQKYYDKGDTELVDGLFTAAEVELLLTPLGDKRPAQYRPDLVLMAMEAKEHLWEREWSPTPLGRRVSRKLTAGFFAGLTEAKSEEGNVDVPEEEDDLIEDLPEDAQPPMLPPSSNEAQPSAAPLRPRASRGDEEDAGVMMT